MNYITSLSGVGSKNLFQLTANVSACFLVLVRSFIGTESPHTVTKMLWVNLIINTFGVMALASLPASLNVVKLEMRSGFYPNDTKQRSISK